MLNKTESANHDSLINGKNMSWFKNVISILNKLND